MVMGGSVVSTNEQQMLLVDGTYFSSSLSPDNRNTRTVIPDQTDAPSYPGPCLRQQSVPAASDEAARNSEVGNYRIICSQGNVLH